MFLKYIFIIPIYVPVTYVTVRFHQATYSKGGYAENLENRKQKVKSRTRCSEELQAESQCMTGHSLWRDRFQCVLSCLEIPSRFTASETAFFID